MSEEPSTETQAGTGAEPKIPPPGEERAQVFAELRSCRRTESMATGLAKLERLALAIHEEELAT